LPQPEDRDKFAMVYVKRNYVQGHSLPSSRGPEHVTKAIDNNLRPTKYPSRQLLLSANKSKQHHMTHRMATDSLAPSFSKLQPRLLGGPFIEVHQDARPFSNGARQTTASQSGSLMKQWLLHAGMAFKILTPTLRLLRREAIPQQSPVWQRAA
jgi:hypothetical protein